jgi:hypothetical protein
VKYSKLLIALVFFVFSVAADGQTPESRIELPVQIVGSFTRVRSDGEHASGYDIDLWKQGAKIYGLINETVLVHGKIIFGALDGRSSLTGFV